MVKALLSQMLVENCAAVLPGGRKYKISDIGIAGFHLVVFPSGTKTYYIRYTDPRGRQAEIRVGHHGAITTAQARKRAAELKARITLGGDPAVERRRLRTFETVSAFVSERFLPHVREHLRAASDYETMCRLRIVPAFGRRPMDEVAPADVAAFRRKLIDEGLSSGRVNRHLAVLRRIFNLALRWGAYTGRNPAQSPGMLREEPRERFLTLVEVRALMAALGRDSDAVAASAIALLALTGARKSEITDARWDCIDFDRFTLTVPLAKSGRARRVQLPDAAVDVLRAQPRVPGQSFVFPSARRPGRPIEGVRAAWARAKAAAGLPTDLRLHDLRHAFASFAINCGSSLYEVGRLLGHSQVSTTARYAHLSAARLHDAANAVGRIAIGRADD